MELVERYAVSSGCYAATVAETTMVLLPSLAYLELDEVGAAIFRGVGEGRSVPEIIDDLHATYEVDVDTLRGDVATYLATLVAHGAIQPG